MNHPHSSLVHPFILGSVAVPKKDLPKQLRDLVDQAQGTWVGTVKWLMPLLYQSTLILSDQKSNSDSDNNQIIVTVITPVITTFGGDDIITNQDTQETQETQKTQPKGEQSFAFRNTHCSV